MSYYSFVFKDSAFKLAKEIEKLKSKIALDEFLKMHQATIEDFQSCFHFFQGLGLEVKTEWEKEILYLAPFQNLPKLNLEISICEWIAISSHFPLMLKFQGKEFNKIAEEALGRVEKDIPDIFGQNHVEQNKSKYVAKMSDKIKEMTVSLEKNIFEKNVITIYKNRHEFDCIPLRLVFLEGKLILIEEEIGLNTLMTIDLESIDKITTQKENEKNSIHSKHSLLEVNDFISKLRSMTGKEERLVLKILSQSDVDLSPNYYFLGNPFLTTNYKNDVIWAATVEDSEELMTWLSSMSDYIEVLDPIHLKKKLQDYVTYQKMSTTVTSACKEISQNSQTEKSKSFKKAG